MAKKKDDFDWITRFSNRLAESDPYALMSVIAEHASDETSSTPKIIVPLIAQPVENCDFIANANTPVCLTSESEIEALYEQARDRILTDENPERFTKNKKHRVAQLRKHQFDPIPFPAISVGYNSTHTLYLPLGFGAPETPFDTDAKLPGSIDFSQADIITIDLHRYSIKVPDLNHKGGTLKVAAAIIQPVCFGANRAGLLITAFSDTNFTKAHRALMAFDQSGRLDVAAMAQQTMIWKAAGIRINTEAESRNFVQRLMMMLIHRATTEQETEHDDEERAMAKRIKKDHELAERIHPELVENCADEEQVDIVFTAAHTLLQAHDATLQELEHTKAQLQEAQTQCEELKCAVEQQATDHKHEMSLALNRIKELETNTQQSDSANPSAPVIASLQSTIDSLKEQLDATRSIQETISTMVLPKNTFDSLTLAAQFWPDRLIVLDQAYTSAEAFDGPAEEPFTHLQALACILWPLVFEENSNHPAQNFAERTTVPMTMKVNKRQLDKAFFDEYHLTYKGQTRDFHAHTKGANFRRGQSLRIHFFFDREERKIVIAHCGDHLTNTMTPHLS